MRKYIPATLLAVLLIVATGLLSFIVIPNGDNLISGMVATQVYIYETPQAGCSVNLTTGVNMVSFYCVTGERTIEESLINSTNSSLNYSAIYKYNANTPTDAWDSYNPNLPNWAIQSLNNLNRRYGYVVVMNSDGEYFREGFRFSNSDIHLSPGWNFIGYPSDNEVGIDIGLSQINGSYTRAEAYTPVSGTKTWLLHIPGSSGTLEFMTPMVGYWVYMNESKILTVDW